jgi:indole-3-glycerol phosphate synthase
MPVLDEILSVTRLALPALRAHRVILERAAAQRADPLDFTQGFRRNRVGLIAEVKRRSPSAGAINEGLDPVALALAYERGGACAISVLTEAHYFGGSLADLTAVVGAVEIPVLRKDFILDEVQLLEARAAGAAAVLLIVRALDQATLIRLQQFAADLGLTPLVETHSAEEIIRALDAGADVIGVNARDLDTLTIDTAAAWHLLRDLPPGCVAVAESGMASGADVEAAAGAGADGVLIGGALASATDPTGRARECSAVVRRGR